MSALKKTTKAMITILVIYGVLVATHLGEFWPFSIFPMFSQAGNPWTRAMAMDVTDITDELGEEIWKTDKVNELPGFNFAMRTYGIDQIDFSNFVSKTRDWNELRVQALRDMIGEENMVDRKLMIYKVRGHMTDDNEVVITATPFILLAPDKNSFNPYLPQNAYFSE